MIHLKSAKLAKWQIRLVVSGGLALWASGALWLWLHYFGQTKGEFGPETNPLEPWMMRIHGAAMIAALIALGSLLVVHVWRGWLYRAHRVHGAILLSLVALLTVSGYLLYYASDEWGRPQISIVHWIIGLVMPAAFTWHYIAGRRLRRS